MLKDSAAIDFAANAFVHLKAVGHSPEADPLLAKANIALCLVQMTLSAAK